MAKLICIVGVTGNQGGSVARRFLQDSNYRVRGLTRKPDSPVAQNLATEGVEIVCAELDDMSTLIPAFAGANLIFSVTNYWEPFFRPDCREAAERQGLSVQKYAYDVELRQGKNIADAAATTVESLDDNGFIASTLSHAGKSSNGAITDAYHFDAKAEVFPYYVEGKYPQLASKMSCVQTGFFTSSYKLASDSYLKALPDGSFQMRFCTTPDASVPHLNVQGDMGNFVYGVSQMPPSKSYMAAGTECSWSEYMRLWSQITGASGSYEQVTLDEMIEDNADKDFGKEIGVMFKYSSAPGYDGGDSTLLKAAHIRKAGIECPMMTLEGWMRKEDWSPILGSN